MIRLLMMAICMLACMVAHADYRILFLNTPSIVIGGKVLKVDDTFAGDAIIKWTSPKQAMRVLNTATGEQRVFVADDFSKANANSLQAYLSRTKRLSTDSAGAPAIASLAAYLNNRFYPLDRLDIATGVPTDARHYFFITYNFNGEEITKAVPNVDGTFTLTLSTFYFTGRKASDEVVVKVYYYDKDADRVTPVCENMRIVPLPTRLK